MKKKNSWEGGGGGGVRVDVKRSINKNLLCSLKTFLVHHPFTSIVQFIFYFWSFEMSGNILRNQKISKV